MTGWNRLPVGGGGFVMQVGISNDAVTKVISTDSGGALVSTNNGPWEQVITHNGHMPSGEFDQTNASRADGSYSMAVAPSDSQRIYLFCKGNAGLGYVYRSNDGGQNFVRTNFRGIYGIDANGAYRQAGPKMAIDPANPDVVYMSSHSDPIGSGLNDGNFCTITAATPGVVTMQNNFYAGQPVSFNFYGGGSVPGGTVRGTVYYVSNSGLSSASFHVSDTQAHGIAGTNQIAFSTIGSLVLICDQADYYTTDGFATSQVVPNLPAAGQHGPSVGICFDLSSSVVGGRTQGVYIFSQGNGLYHSTSYTGSVPNFSLVAGSPSWAWMGKCSFDGVYYTSNANTPAGGSADFHRFQSSVWTDLTAAYTAVQSTPDPVGLATDPFTAGKMYIVQGVAFGGARLGVSTNYGTSFAAMKTPVRATGAGQPAWLDNSIDTYGIGDITPDPITADKFWLATGMGVRYTTNTTGATVTWTSFSAGIEELVWGRIVSPPGHNVLACCYDRGVFQLNTSGVYPTHQTWDETKDAPDGISHSCDWASSDPNYQAVVLYSGGGNSGYSSTGGGYGTWNAFASRPSPDPAGVNGSIACSSPLCSIYVGYQGTFYTRNGGSSWTLITDTMWNASGAYGNPAGDYTGFSNYAFLYRQSIAADRTLTDTFYIQNWKTSAQGGGVYKITFPAGVLNIVRMDSSGTFNQPGLGLFNVLMECPIGYGGYCFITAGQDQSGTTGLQWTDNQFTNLYQVANIGEVYAFGFGLAKSGNNFPTIYVVGYKSGVYGIWRGDGNLADWQAGSKTGSAVTWTKIGDFPLNSAALIQSITGDNNRWGWCYTASNINGIFYYDPGTINAINAGVGFSVVHGRGGRNHKMIGY